MAKNKRMLGAHMARQLHRARKFVDQYPETDFRGLTMNGKGEIRIAVMLAEFLQLVREEGLLRRVQELDGDPDNERECCELVAEVSEGIVLVARGPVDSFDRLDALPRPSVVRKTTTQVRSGPDVVRRRRAR